MTMKGLPGGYNRDLQEDKEAVFDAEDTLAASLDACAAVVAGLTLNAARAEAAASGLLLATDVADYLVARGVPFRDAHAIVGAIVRKLVAEGRDFASLTPGRVAGVQRPHSGRTWLRRVSAQALGGGEADAAVDEPRRRGAALADVEAWLAARVRLPAARRLPSCLRRFARIRSSYGISHPTLKGFPRDCACIRASFGLVISSIDYCPRERRLSNHAIVAMVGDDIRQVRCTTCDAEHDVQGGKGARQPQEGRPACSRRKLPAGAAAGTVAPGLPERLPVQPATSTATGPQATDVRRRGRRRAGGPGRRHHVAGQEGPVHRRLIRATLPRIESDVPARPGAGIHDAHGRVSAPRRHGRPLRRASQGGQPRHGGKRRRPAAPARRPRSRRQGGAHGHAAARAGRAGTADPGGRRATAGRHGGKPPRGPQEALSHPHECARREVRPHHGRRQQRSIAWAIAKALAADGARLALTYQGERLLENVQELAAELTDPLLLPCDVTSDEQIAEVFETIEREFGGLDFLLHGTAFAPREELSRPFVETTPRGLPHRARRQRLLARRAVPRRRAADGARGGGSIVTLTYLGSERVFTNYNVMGVAKAALEACVRYLAAGSGRRTSA